jgi:hypothetical protein
MLHKLDGVPTAPPFERNRVHWNLRDGKFQSGIASLHKSSLKQLDNLVPSELLVTQYVAIASRGFLTVGGASHPARGQLFTVSGDGCTTDGE